MSPGATYSPGAWFALVAPTVAVLIDPELPGARLDELWRAVQAQQGADPALAVISKAAVVGRPAFALAALDGSSVRLIIRGSLQVTVQDALGRERQMPVVGEHAWREETVSASDVLWFVRPGGRADGVALPIVSGAVLADVLAWQAGVPAEAVQPGPAEVAAVAVPCEPEPPAVVPAVAEAVAPGPAGRPLRSVPVAQTRVTPQAARRSAGLGSHPRRRYGASDWSLAAVAGASAGLPPGSGIDTAVPDTRVAPTVPPEVRHGGVHVPEAGAGQPPEPVVPEPVVPEPEVEQQAEAEGVPEPGRQPDVEPEPESGAEPGPRAAVCHGVLEFDDGQRVDVDRPVIIGRAPSQVEGDRPARLVVVPEASRGLSRNHVRIDVGLQGPFVVDLGSRNGTTMRSAGRTAVRLDPWMPYPLDPGAELVFAQIICTFRGADQPSE